MSSPNPASPKPPTIYDVAMRAGVSHQTVSRVLRGLDGMRDSTRDRVLAVLAELDYHPSSAARSLRQKPANRIALLAYGISENGPARVIQGVFAEARRRGYIIDMNLVDESDPESLGEGVARALEQRVVGLLAYSQTDEFLSRLRQHVTNVPVGGEVQTVGGRPSVNVQAGWLAAHHLISLGHRSIGYVSGHLGWDAARARLSGFESRLRQSGLSLTWMREGDWSSTSGYRAWPSLDPDERRVTAVGTVNDSTAFGLVSSLHEHGLSVPGDVSVVGVDDLPDARFHLPSLSTIALDHEGEGALSIAQLIDRIEGREPSEEDYITLLNAPVLRQRDSTAPWRKG